MLYFGRWKTLSILFVIILGMLFTLPNMVPESVRFPSDADGERLVDIEGEPLPAQFPWNILPNKGVNLGLDLQGGAHLVFEVDMEQVRRDQIIDLRERVRGELSGQPRILARSITVQDGGVAVVIARPEEAEEAYTRLRGLIEPIPDPTTGAAGFDRTLTVEQDGQDPRLIRLAITPEQYAAIERRMVQQSINVIGRRLNGMGTSEPNIQSQGNNRVLVQLPGADDTEEIKDRVGTAARLEFRMVAPIPVQQRAGINQDTCEGRAPPAHEILPVQPDPTRPGTGENCLVVEQRARLTGDNLQNASVGQPEGQVVVNFRFDRQGGGIFRDLTQQNVGERFAVVLDGEIISAPRIRTPILTGSGYIEGGFDFTSATLLSVQLNAGALPADLTAVEERTVGATLGQDSIEAGRIAIIIGFAGVIIFMLAVYGVFGVFSTLALVVNVLLIIGALSMLQATLTLPGIAGIILTIGMAVDANVLIFERIREESRQGRTIANSIEAGYSRALSAILDANITTFVAAAVLIMLGAGPVRGFAVTLGIGIITSVFTAFMFSRLLAVTWLRGFKPKTLPL
jgi:protein-export membrane protein SecD